MSPCACDHGPRGHAPGWPYRAAPCTVLVRQPTGELRTCACGNYTPAASRTRRRSVQHSRSMRLARWLLGQHGRR